MNTTPNAPLSVEFPPSVNRDEMAEARGRNGWIKCSGLIVHPLEHHRRIQLQAVNSRGETGSAVIELPLDSKVLRMMQAKFRELAEHAERLERGGLAPDASSVAVAP